jgi:hypothetical protein
VGEDVVPWPVFTLLDVFALLPLDARLLCRGVCRCWRARLCTRSLWTTLDASIDEHRLCLEKLPTGGLLLAAAEQAGWQVTVLDLRHSCVTVLDLVTLVAAVSASLRELRLGGCSLRDPPDLLTARNRLACVLQVPAPALRVVEVDVDGVDLATAGAMLRREPPLYAALHMCSLSVRALDQDGAALLQFARDLAAHGAASLRTLQVWGTRYDTAPAALDALVDAAIAAGVASFSVSGMTLDAAARLLEGGALRTLKISCAEGQDDTFFAEPALGRFCAALRGSRLEQLNIGSASRQPPLHADDNDGDSGDETAEDGVRYASPFFPQVLPYAARMWDCGAGAAIVGACVEHPTLRELSLCNHPATADAGAARAAAGAALGRLVVANAPALQNLSLRNSRLGDVGMAPIFDALACNTHLDGLDVAHADMSDELLRTRVLAAVRANTSLRGLNMCEGARARRGVRFADYAWTEAVELVSQRQQQEWLQCSM